VRVSHCRRKLGLGGDFTLVQAVSRQFYATDSGSFPGCGTGMSSNSVVRILSSILVPMFSIHLSLRRLGNGPIIKGSVAADKSHPTTRVFLGGVGVGAKKKHSPRRNFTFMLPCIVINFFLITNQMH
jgi:hypothetical protein